MGIEGLPRISVVIATRDRPKDLAELLLTILGQSYPPLEVIIVDDSDECAAKKVTNLFKSDFEMFGCVLKYVKGSGDGLPAARNLGVETSAGDAVLFLDDDTLLTRNVIEMLANFLKDNSKAIGVQPKIVPSMSNIDALTKKFENAVYKALMLSYYEENSLKVRRSGTSVLPNSLTKIISAQRLSGCCCCYRREIFNKLRFDTNLKRWGFMEDLDFSYRIYRCNSKSLYTIPNAKIIHKVSQEARLQTKLSIYMATIYWFYVFFKDIFENSILNLIAFIWALTGNLVAITGRLIIKKKSKQQWWKLVYLVNSYLYAFRHLKKIKRGNLHFFNKQLGQ